MCSRDEELLICSPYDIGYVVPYVPAYRRGNLTFYALLITGTWAPHQRAIQSVQISVVWLYNLK